MLEEFDRYVFESIVEKVIVGGYDEEGNKDPELITFIYKSGFKDSLTSHDFRSPRKSYAARKESYHSSEYEGEDACQNGGGDTRRDASDVVTKKSIKTAIFKAENDVFQPFFAFSFSYPNLTVDFIVCFAMQEQAFFDSPGLLGYVRRNLGSLLGYVKNDR